MSSPRACLKPDDALKHVLVVGPTGVGKSTFLYWWARSAIELGHGVLVLDPKGDLVAALLAAVPPERAQDTVFLDFADTEWPVALNPLDVRSVEEGERVAAAVLRADEGAGERRGLPLGHVDVAGLRLRLPHAGGQPAGEAHELDLERLFFDRAWRERLLPRVRDPFVRSYWRLQVDRVSARQFEMTFGGALRRLAMLVQDPRVRNILVQPRSAVEWDRVLDGRGIVLANLDQADNALGQAGSRLLGSILVTQFWQAVLRRPMESRQPFFAVFDEFQEFLDTGRDMAAFFERSRSYGVGVTVATQNPSHPRLKPILESVLINTRTHVLFGGLRGQVRHFAGEMAPVFSKEELDDLPAYHTAIKTLVDNRQARPFEGYVAPIPTGGETRARALRERCRQSYGKPRGRIDELVAERYGGLDHLADLDAGDMPPASPAANPSDLDPGDREPHTGADHGALRGL